jgi:hypothetical protein
MAKWDEDQRSTFLWVMVVVLTIVGVPSACYVHDLHLDQRGAGKLDLVHLLRLPDGRPVLVAMERVRHSEGDGDYSMAGRLDLVDPASGAQLVRKIRVAVRDCLAATAGQLWCLELGSGDQGWGLVLRDKASLEVAATSAQLASAVPALAKGIVKEGNVLLEPDAGAVLVPVNDGSTWRIEPAGCPAKCLASEVPHVAEVKGLLTFGPPVYNPSPVVTTSSVKVGDRQLGFTNGPRSALAWETAPQAALGSSTFLKPEFLIEPDGRPLVLDRAAVVVKHADTLDDSKAQTVLTAVGLDGSARWSVELGRGPLLAAWRIGDLLVVAVEQGYSDEATGLLLGIDPRDGQVRWRYST